jgi:hypothetical protein
VGNPLDVDARLAEGRPAVGNVGDYVWACHLLGYQNPDLTLHAAQVRDWYGSEDGLDLRALDADRAALEAVATAADDARQLQERQTDVLAGAWQGQGGDASREFLLRHGQASAAVASAVRDAVDALAALREDLWRAVDEKVTAAVAIEDRRQSERAQWRAAAQTVTTGAGDRAVASEMVDQQVKPFVDNDIRTDWLTAMQSAMAAVTAAFDAATGTLAGEHPVGFEVPGDLGPSAVPSWSGPTPSAGTAGTAPAGWPSAVSPAAPAAGPIAAPPPAFAAPEPPPAAWMPAAPMGAPPATAPTSATPALPSTPSLGELGGGLPGGAGGLAGLGSQFADAIGGLLNHPNDMLPDPSEPDETVEEDKPVDEEPVDEEPADEEVDGSAEDETDADPGEVAESVEPAADTVEGCADEAGVDEAPPAEPVATAPPAPMPPPQQPIVEPPPSAEPLGARTPCEIAADELPQAGP